MASKKSPAFPDPGHDHDRCRAGALTAAEEVCAKTGARLTELRRRVLEMVWDSHEPAGAYALLDRLRAEGYAGGPPTVYRALEFLLDQGLIHRIASRNAYVGCIRPGERHGAEFLLCESCGTAVEIEGDGIGAAVTQSAERLGFAVTRPTVEIEGRCPACRKTGREGAR